MNHDGFIQAERAANRLNAERLNAVYTSPVERAAQTAESIARGCGAPVIETDALTEIDFGAWSGLEFSTLCRSPEWQQWNEQRDLVRPPGGESMIDVQSRVNRWLNSLNRSNERVAAVSHGDVIKAAVMLAIGLPTRMHDRIEISIGSITTLVLGEWGMKLHALNETPRD
jgi:probable phosphoglycerate mutase